MSTFNTVGLKKVFSCGAAAVVMAAFLTGVFLQSASTPPASATQAEQVFEQPGLQLAQAN
jgi:hypothetical protein